MLQLLWRESKKVGCGVSTNDIDIFYVVCKYDSASYKNSNHKANFPQITRSDIDKVKENNSKHFAKKINQKLAQEMALYDSNRKLYKKYKYKIDIDL